MLRAGQAKRRPKLLPLPLRSSHCVLLEDPTPPIVSCHAVFVAKLLNCSMSTILNQSVTRFLIILVSAMKLSTFILEQQPFKIETKSTIVQH